MLLQIFLYGLHLDSYRPMKNHLVILPVKYLGIPGFSCDFSRFLLGILSSIFQRSSGYFYKILPGIPNEIPSRIEILWDIPSELLKVTVVRIQREPPQRPPCNSFQFSRSQIWLLADQQYWKCYLMFAYFTRILSYIVTVGRPPISGEIIICIHDAQGVGHYILPKLG